ncbi:MAG: YraN family protein [Gammaproteobacteria bacterium]|jgi:putative endonuclease|nr:YraN family protein [Gammaproteobacteria bacterium]
MKSLGDHYEQRAAAWLQAQGLTIAARNFRCATGEIDIIAWDGAQLVFVEVRARTNARYAGAAASISARKRHRLVRTAQFYLQQQQTMATVPCRFDVIAFEPRQSSSSDIRWIRSAFTA